MDITTRVSFDDFQDVVVPLCKIIKTCLRSSIMGIMILASISVINNSLVLAKAKIKCALEISEDIFNSRPMASRWSCAMSELVNLQTLIIIYR